MTRTAFLVVVVSLFLLSGCGSMADSDTNNELEHDGQCTVPAGTYTQTWSDNGGDCPQEFVNDMTSVNRDIEVEEGTECGKATHSNSGTTDGGCDFEWNATTQRTEYGFQDAQASVEISCPNGLSCTHDFNRYFEKR